ncbi:hypothetical protein Aau02nite_42000 [Amorphoplanes auranticolor]|uniref:Phosphotransferase family enzyme n=1 Tax=Actinoplanes auranticolor TaxID=47988 RepID=A0A919SFE1_9ACTN|nr:hypothetical protein Aau02nite_42000 [Actinoplanes auranticolor]
MVNESTRTSVPGQRTPSDPLVGTDPDPRGRQDGLGWVTRAIFGDPRLRVTVGDDPAATVRYAVIPSLDHARFLLPLASRKVTAASLLAYNALRPPKVRAGRAAVGLLARVGALGLTRAPVLSVHAPERELLLSSFLADQLGQAELHAAIGIRPPDPHHKPTLQLFDADGRPRGYAKIGWNDGTRAMVRAEAATLTELPAGNGFPPAPRLILHTRWNGREIAVIEPMPRRVRRISKPDTPRLDAMLAVARWGSPATAAQPVTALLAGWRARAEGADPRIHAVIDKLDPELTLEFGHWHGDWVPWNMARHQGGLLVWDWENSAPGVPIGFDLAHQAFQTTLSTRGRPAAECAAAVDEALRRHGAALGLADPVRQRFVADAYLVELWLRTYELSGGGAGWNPKLHPALLDILGERLP